ncbi:ribosomal protein L2 [Schizopora paradoxa]|uniref:Large ribosomal subunit protein uL2m n=1 Tax=Schizopora paradoxa TaxID=27342 RepID=A0A0H2SFK9_9AGAM|nr:ribosomal protein L2 [Schizopora paradoxa]
MLGLRAGFQLFSKCSVIREAVCRQTPSTWRTYATEVQRPGEINDALARSSSIFKTYKPITPSIRHLRRPINDHLYKGGPIKTLTIPRRKKGGRNNQGRITVRGIGGGHKQRIRTVDFMRSDPGPQDVIRIEYDPGRSAHIALVRARNAEANGGRRFSYILAPEGIRSGAVVESFRNGIPDGFVPGFVDSKRGKPTYTGENEGVAENAGVQAGSASTASLALGLLRAATVKPGNVLPLRLIPPGTLIHCVSLFPERAGILVRSAGTFAQVVAHDEQGKYTQVKLQSGEVRKVLQDCCATIGKVSNPLWRGRVLGKAGRNRWLGRRPHVRGVAMNRVDHPHGGGRGKSKGNKQPRSVWGWLTKGKRTRRPGPKGPKNSNKMVVRERPRGKEKRNL